MRVNPSTIVAYYSQVRIPSELTANVLVEFLRRDTAACSSEANVAYLSINGVSVTGDAKLSDPSGCCISAAAAARAAICTCLAQDLKGTRTHTKYFYCQATHWLGLSPQLLLICSFTWNLANAWYPCFPFLACTRISGIVHSVTLSVTVKSCWYHLNWTSFYIWCADIEYH